MSEPQRRVGERYEVLGRLSAGPGGDIWCGRDLLTGSGCALRVLEPGFAADPVAGFEFLGVLGRIGRLAHPAIVAVSDVVTGDGCSALVMRLISGESLRARLDRHGPLERAEAAELVAQLCDALSAAHAVGLAHGRVKPSNVMLEPGADALTVKVTDFGMAGLNGRSVNGAAHSLATAIEAAQYRAPELGPVTPATETLAIAPPSTTPTPVAAPPTALPLSAAMSDVYAADVYAAGVVLYETLAGRPPFTGTQPDEIARLHREFSPPRIPGLPDAIWLLLTACLAKQPHLRPAAGDLASLLRDIVPSAPRRAEPVVLTATAIVDPPQSEPPQPQQPATPTAVIAPAFSRRSMVRTRRTELAITAGLTLLICGFAYTLGGVSPLDRPAIGSAVLPGTDAATRAASVTGTGGGSVIASPDASAGPSSPATAGGSPSPGTGAGAGTSAVASTGPALAAGTTTSAAALSSSPAASESASAVATSPAAGPVSGLPIADPIAFLEKLRATIQALVAQGRATIDPNAAGDLENLVLDLENSVIAYQQNGGAAHLTEIKNKIIAFDARLAQLVVDGRISRSAAVQLADYLQQLSPS